MEQFKKFIRYLLLILSIFIYSIVGVCTRYASLYPSLSWQYIAFVSGAVLILGIYAILWQQIIQRMELGLAYMFKGTALIWTMVFSALLFSEAITITNIIGAIIIIAGICLYSMDTGKEAKV